MITELFSLSVAKLNNTFDINFESCLLFFLQFLAKQPLLKTSRLCSHNIPGGAPYFGYCVGAPCGEYCGGAPCSG